MKTSIIYIYSSARERKKTIKAASNSNTMMFLEPVARTRHKKRMDVGTLSNEAVESNDMAIDSPKKSDVKPKSQADFKKMFSK
jgi:hypothetical protein